MEAARNWEAVPALDGARVCSHAEAPGRAMAQQLRLTDFFPRGKSAAAASSLRAAKRRKGSAPATPRASGPGCPQAPLGSRKRRRPAEPGAPEGRGEGAARTARRRLLMPAEEGQEAAVSA